MRSSTLAAALASLSTTAHAQSQQEDVYTVWASVLINRVGARTPAIIGTLPTTLTSLGANQAFSAGAFFRRRYLTSAGTPNGLTAAPLVGLNEDVLSPLQVSVESADDQVGAASALAWLQGFYPPFVPSGSGQGQEGMWDPADELANGTYITAPLNGYQYAAISTSSSSDPASIYLSGSSECPAWSAAASAYGASASFAATQAATLDMYKAVGAALLQGVLPEPYWSYANAYAIYDYVSYQAAHNATAAGIISSEDISLPALAALAAQQQSALLGNLTTSAGEKDLPWGVQGSVATIGGNTLAAQVLNQLSAAVQAGAQGDVFAPLSVSFSDFAPLVSFFALNGLPGLNANFADIPAFAATLAFELFSHEPANVTVSFPRDLDELYVRFLFRNGSSSSSEDDGEEMIAYPLFFNGPDTTDLPWSTFAASLSSLALAQRSPEDWCTTCAASSVFCAPYNASLLTTAAQFSLAGQQDGAGWWYASVVAGVIGGVVGIVLAGVVFGLVMLFAGVRVRKVDGRAWPRRRRSSDGGFKGGRKMASDADLRLPKHGAEIVTAEEVKPAHERTGSWEMKASPASPVQIHGGAGWIGEPHRASMDEQVDPFEDPVRPREAV